MPLGHHAANAGVAVEGHEAAYVFGIQQHDPCTEHGPPIGLPHLQLLRMPAEVRVEIGPGEDALGREF